MRKAALGLALLLCLPLTARAGSLELRVGAMFPRADSNLFDDDAELYGTRKSDWISAAGGVEYAHHFGEHVEVGIHLDGYGRELDTSYRDFVDEDRREILQTLRLDIVPLGATVRFLAGDHHSRVRPYAAFGVDAVFWNYEEEGEFIDFFDADRPIYDDFFKSDGVAGGLHAAAGVRVRLNDDFSLTGEARYLFGRDTMGDDFQAREAGLENKIDLSGAQVTVGINLRF